MKINHFRFVLRKNLKFHHHKTLAFQCIKTVRKFLAQEVKQELSIQKSFSSKWKLEGLP